MTIDKSWTRIRNRSSSSEFITGLNAFIERCKDHLNDQNRCRCPCQKCNNHEWGTLVDIRNHIFRWGFSAAYKTWSFHGEQYDLPVIHDTSEPTGEMVDVLNDVRWENTGNEHEANIDERSYEPTEGSSGANDNIDALHMEVETELYLGCTWLSSLNVLAKMMHMKVMNKWSDSSFDQLLEFLRSAFPNDNKVLSSNYEAKKKMKKLGLGYESIHACKNDCCLFWKENVDMQSCPICGESRWKDTNTTGKKVAQKQDSVTDQFPSLIDNFGQMHQRNNEYVSSVAQNEHQQMEELRRDQVGSSNPMNEDQILSQVLGERRGHKRGRGKKLPAYASSSSYQPNQERVYTQKEVDEMMWNQNANFAIIYDALKRANIDVPDFQPFASENNEDSDSTSEED